MDRWLIEYKGSAVASTSGTVATYPYSNMKIIDHACRRAGLVPQKLGSEDLEICLDLLFTLSAEWTNAGFPLWTTQFRLLGCQIGSPDVPTLPGTMEILHSYWRIFNPYRGPCTLTDDSGDILLFGGQPNDDVVVPGPNPSVMVNYTTPTEVDTVGVLLGGSASITAGLQLYISDDGATWTLFQTLPSATYQPGQWTYFDLNPTITTQFLRITYDTQNQPGTWTLNQLQFAVANGQDIENGPLNIDDYYNLPNKQFRSDRPNSTYQQRNIDVPVLKIWPTLNTEGFYNGTISCLTRRYIQDPGKLTDVMELPIRWYEAITWRLASRVIHEIPNPEIRTADAGMKQALMQDRIQRIPVCDAEATKSEMLAWSEERVRAPIKLYPNVGVYTR